MPFNSLEFTQELLRDSGLTEDQKLALQSAFANQQVARKLEEGYLRQSDYSRQVAEAQQTIQKAKAYHQELTQWKQAEVDKLNQERARLGDTDGSTPNSAYLSKQELDEELAKRDSGAIGLLAQMSNKTMEYYQEFGKPLDINAVLKKAQDEGVKFETAYDLFTQPARAEKNNLAVEERVKREREEAVREFLAKQTIPSSAPGTFGSPFGGPAHVLDQIKDKPAGEYGWRAAVAAHTKDIQAGTVKNDG